MLRVSLHARVWSGLGLHRFCACCCIYREFTGATASRSPFLVVIHYLCVLHYFSFFLLFFVLFSYHFPHIITEPLDICFFQSWAFCRCLLFSPWPNVGFCVNHDVNRSFRDDDWERHWSRSIKICHQTQFNTASI